MACIQLRVQVVVQVVKQEHTPLLDLHRVLLVLLVIIRCMLHQAVLLVPLGIIVQTLVHKVVPNVKEAHIPLLLSLALLVQHVLLVNIPVLIQARARHVLLEHTHLLVGTIVRLVRRVHMPGKGLRHVLRHAHLVVMSLDLLVHIVRLGNILVPIAQVHVFRVQLGHIPIMVQAHALPVPREPMPPLLNRPLVHSVLLVNMHL